LAREIVLIDIKRENAYGEALDIRHGIPFMGNAHIYAGDYSDCSDCDLIIITAGRNRRPGETRLDLTNDNIVIVSMVTKQLMKYYTRGVIMVVTNPVDIITYKLKQWTGLPNGLIIGTGCILDTSRLINYVADYVGLSTNVVNGFVAGEHGDGQFPVWSRLSIAGESIGEYCRANNLPWGESQKTEIAIKIKNTGTEIIIAKGCSHYGIATCVCFLADAILNRRATVACISNVLEGEYGIYDIALSVPSIVGGNGIEQKMEETWNDQEVKQLKMVAEQLTLIQKRISNY
jgi:L-lactate dehydrogenase